jgi:hypothetical protein
MSNLFYNGATATPPSGPGPSLIIDDSLWQSDTPQSVEHFWTNDQLVAGTSTWQHTTLKWQTSMLPAGFEPKIPATKRPQTHALYRAATATGVTNYIPILSPIVCRIAQSVYRLATGWMDRESNPGGGEIFRTQPPVQWVPGLSRDKERPGRNADPSPPSSAMVMKE